MSKLKLIFCGTVFVFLLLHFVDCQNVAKQNAESHKSLRSIGEGRTYSHFFSKQMSLLLLPLMFKFGIAMTLLILLTFTSINGLAIGVILMVLGLSHILARAYQAAPLVSAAPVAYAQPAAVAYAPAYAPSYAHTRVVSPLLKSHWARSDSASDIAYSGQYPIQKRIYSAKDLYGLTDYGQAYNNNDGSYGQEASQQYPSSSTQQDASYSPEYKSEVDGTVYVSNYPSKS